MQVKDSVSLEQIIHLPLHFLVANEEQPRGRDSFKDQSIQELAQSIQAVGLLQPLLVCKKDEDHYQIIAGERRFRAAKVACLKTVPVIVQNYGSLKEKLAAIIENVQRENLNPLDTALALDRLLKSHSLTQQKLAELIGMSRPSLANTLRLLSLPPFIQKALKNEQISMGHAKVLLSIENAEIQTQLFQCVIRDHLSVRETEKLAEKSKVKKTKGLDKKSSSIFLRHIQEQLQEKMGTKVSFKGSNDSGILSFHYYNLSDLNRLLNLLGYQDD